MSIQCIKEVNQDIAAGFKSAYRCIKAFTPKDWWVRNKGGVIILSVIMSMFVIMIGSLFIGVEIVATFFPDNKTAFMWVPIVSCIVSGMLWGYGVAVIQKCTGIIPQ